MIFLILKIIFALSIFGILIIIIRKIPTLSQLPDRSVVGKFSFKAIFAWFRNSKNQLISSDFFQTGIIGNLEKSLRRFKIAALKFANIIDKFIRKIKRHSNNKPS